MKGKVTLSVLGLAALALALTTRFGEFRDEGLKELFLGNAVLGSSLTYRQFDGNRNWESVCTTEVVLTMPGGQLQDVKELYSRTVEGKCS